MLTDLQRVVLAQLREHGCPKIADSAKRCWKRNQGYYIDPRAKCPRWLRRMFVKANDQIELKGGRK